MRTKIIGSWLILIGIISLAGTIYLYPPGGLPGSYSSPISASSFQTSQHMMMMAETVDIPQEYYIESNSLAMATQSTNNQVIPMTFQRGTRYESSYIFKDTLTSSEYMSLSSEKEIIGIWDVPTIIYQKPALTDVTSSSIYGDMADALTATHTDELISMGYSGQDTIVAIIDDYPSESDFYETFPSSWSNRVLNYPSNPGSGTHGIMTAGIVAGVSPDTLLYLIEMSGDPISCFQEIIGLIDIYPDYDIISSNSYVYGGTAYYDSNHPIHRKILETTDNEITVLFGAGNWAHTSEHNAEWTLEVGYDSRSDMFERDSEIGYPGVFDEVISVAGCNAFGDKIVSYSSLGRGVGNYDEPDISAPTHHSYDYSPYGGLTLGTSASTPFMAGICANILSGKNADVDRMIGSIQSYSTDRGTSGFDEEFGYGVVDAVEIFNNYDIWIPSPDEVPDLSMYMVSIGMLGMGIVVYNKKNIFDMIGG